jgi:hypothetical protein
MTAPTTDYLTLVREELADLRPGVRDPLLEDLGQHLDELRAEDPDLDAMTVLGDPRVYARELREAGGLPSKRTVGTRLGSLVDQLPPLPRSLGWLSDLNGAWWVLRAYPVLVLIGWFQHHAGDGNVWPTYDWTRMPIPLVEDSSLYGLMLLLGIVIVSVLAGKLSARRLVGGLAAAVMVLNLGLAVIGVNELWHFTHVKTYVGDSYSPPPAGELGDSNGNTISNFYAYDENGKLIPRVQLFDQTGKPVVLSPASAYGPTPVVPNVYPKQTGSFNGSTVLPDPVPVVDVPALGPAH